MQVPRHAFAKKLRRSVIIRELFCPFHNYTGTARSLIPVKHCSKYRRSGKFRVVKFSCFIILCKNIFVFNSINSTFPGLVIYNETTHIKKQTACCIQGYEGMV